MRYGIVAVFFFFVSGSLVEAASAAQLTISEVRARLTERDQAFNAIVKRRDVAMLGLSRTESMPSRFLAAAQSAPELQVAATELGHDAVAGTIASSYNVMCLDDGWVDADTPHLTLASDIAAARLWDARVRLMPERCPPPPGAIQVNTPGAGEPTDTSSFAAGQKAQAEAERKRQAPYRISSTETLDLELAQAYRTDLTVIPSYLSKRLSAVAAAVPAALKSKPAATASTFSGGARIGTKVILITGNVLITPSIAAAALIHCAATNRYHIGWSFKIDAIQQQQASGMLTPADLQVGLRQVSLMADQLDSCVDRELEFLVRREMASTKLQPIAADCNAFQSMSDPTTGVYGRLLFGLSADQKSDLLSLSPAERSALVCRAGKLTALKQAGATSIVCAALTECP